MCEMCDITLQDVMMPAMSGFEVCGLAAGTGFGDRSEEGLARMCHVWDWKVWTRG